MNLCASLIVVISERAGFNLPILPQIGTSLINLSRVHQNRGNGEGLMLLLVILMKKHTKEKQTVHVLITTFTYQLQSWKPFTYS